LKKKGLDEDGLPEKHKVTVKEVEDEDSPQNISVRNHSASLDPPAPMKTMTSNTEHGKRIIL
jgi:hypothetical protein